MENSPGIEIYCLNTIERNGLYSTRQSGELKTHRGNEHENNSQERGWGWRVQPEKRCRLCTHYGSVDSVQVVRNWLPGPRHRPFQWWQLHNSHDSADIYGEKAELGQPSSGLPRWNQPRNSKGPWEIKTGGLHSESDVLTEHCRQFQ